MDFFQNSNGNQSEGFENAKPENIVRPSYLPLTSEEGTPTNLSSPSSGTSTPSFRRRPKKPDIKLSELNKPYQDYIEILRAESLSSLQSDIEDKSNRSNRNSYIEISEGMIAKAFLSQQFQNEINEDNLHEFEKTIEGPSEDHEESFWDGISKVCDERPSSPTAEFFHPLLLNKTNGGKALYLKISTILHRMKDLEEQVEELSSLKVKLAILQEEKRQLSTLLQIKRQNEEKETRDAAVQKSYEIVTEISHKETSTYSPLYTSIDVGGEDIAEITFENVSSQCQVSLNHVSCQYESNRIIDKSTQTVSQTIDVGSGGNGPAEIIFASKGIQKVPKTMGVYTQTDSVQCRAVGNMMGTSMYNFIDTGVGDDVCEQFYKSEGTQTRTLEIAEKFVQVAASFDNKSTETNPKAFVNRYVQACVDTTDFLCGNNIADVTTADKCTFFAPQYSNVSINTEQTSVCHQYIQCIINKPSVTVGIGEGNVMDLQCDRCANISVKDKCCGEHSSNELPFCTNDILCDCAKTELFDKSTSIDVTLISVGIGEGNINDVNCEKCAKGEENVFNFDLNFTSQQPVMCHYCGNKVDLNDSNLDESLQAMRDSMQSISSGLKRSVARKDLNLELEYQASNPNNAAITPVSDDTSNISEDEEELVRYAYCLKLFAQVQIFSVNSVNIFIF